MNLIKNPIVVSHINVTEFEKQVGYYLNKGGKIEGYSIVRIDDYLQYSCLMILP